MNQEIIKKEEIQKQIKILKQQIEDKELVFQGLLEMLEKQNEIEEDK